MIRKHTTIEVFLLIGLCLSGASALIYEVVWTRALSLVMGSTTYALSTMLASFMAGLTIGGYIGGLWADKSKDPAYAFGVVEAGIGIFGIITFVAIKKLSLVYAWVFYTFHLSFSAFSFVQFILSLLLMLIPTTLMGITFPLVLKARSKNLDEVGREAGDVYSINNLGAIIGSFMAGFVLIPILGSTWTIIIAGTLNLIVGVIILLYKKMGWGVLSSIILFITVSYISYASLFYAEVPFSYYFAQKLEGFGSFSLFNEMNKMDGTNLLFHKEGVQGEVFVYKGETPDMPPILVNNGKLEGGGDIPHSLIAYIALASHSAPKTVLNIGLGTGNTLSVIKETKVDRIDSVEISPEIIEANKLLISPRLFSDARINHIIADARNFLYLAPDKYDVIISVPSIPVEFASASLLTNEFFALAKDRLNDNGIFAQWFDYYLFSNADTRLMIRTFARVFPFTTVWHAGGIIMLIGSKEPFAHSEDDVISAVTAAAPELSDKFSVGMTAKKIQNTKWLTGVLNTDDRPLLEFNAGRNIMLGERAVAERKGK